MSLLLLAAAVLLVLLAIRIIYDRFWSVKLHATVNFRDQHAFEGDQTELVEVIVNDKPLPLPTLEIDFHLNRNLRFTDFKNATVSDKLYRRDVFSLGGKKKITRRLPLTCAKRGYFTLETVGLMTNDLFMTHKYLTSFSQWSELYVYPRRISSDKISIPFSKIMGDVLSRDKLYDDPFAFAGIRDYRISDPMKYINWKASAKSGELVVNLHDSSLSQTVTVILDTYDSASPLEDELNEECIRIAAALSERIIRSGISLTVIGNGFDLLSHKKLRISDIKGADSVLVRKTLSRLHWDDTEKVEAVMGNMKPTANTLYVLVSKNGTEAARAALERLSVDRDGLWILPYKGETPTVQSRRFKLLPWRDDRAKL